MQLQRIFLLSFFACGSVAFAVPEAWEAASHNTGISGSLLGSNRCGFEVKAATEGDPFSYAGMRTVSLVPQIDNVTSDLSHPQLVWSWGADAPPSIKSALPGSTECPGGEVELFNRSAISFSEGKIAYRFGKEEKESILSATGPNPFQLVLNASDLRESDYAELYANLTIKLSAKAGVSYSFRKRELYRKCDYFGNFTVCYCAEKFTAGKRNYENAMGDIRNYSVEIGPVREFWINPPLQKRLEGNAKGKVLFFARRMPSRITAIVGAV